MVVLIPHFPRFRPVALFFKPLSALGGFETLGGVDYAAECRHAVDSDILEFVTVAVVRRLSSLMLDIDNVKTLPTHLHSDETHRHSRIFDCGCFERIIPTIFFTPATVPSGSALPLLTPIITAKTLAV